MSNKRDTGGPAFPRPISEDRASGDPPDGNSMISDQEGMHLRDWFAGQALAGYLAAHAGEGIEMPDAAKTGRRAYQFADAMLAARTAPPAPQS